MKVKIIFFVCLSIFGFHTESNCQNSKIMTYNIKFDNPRDSINNWDNRKLEVVSMLKYYEPEIFGLQEALEHQLNFIDQHLNDYSRIGVGRDDGKHKGEFSPIYYNNKKFSLIESSTFWLSDTDSVVSVGWDASMERICTYGIFEDKLDNSKILVLNTHFDHKGKKAREESAKLIVRKVGEINKENNPVILMGDFNATLDSRTIETIKEKLVDGAELSKNGIYGPTGTFTGFKIGKIPEERIDFIFVKNLKVSKYRHIDDMKKNNNFLSDHLPVLLELNNRGSK